jgi:hypothetical protein
MPLPTLAPVLRWLPMLALLLSAGLASAQQGDRPGVFLQGASVPRAKGLALDAALIKGWQVAQSEPNHVIFETTLEQPASIGPPNAITPEQTLLRIRADFVETPAGVNAYLYAEEIWYADTPKEWITDVTPQYRGNLSNALSSLQTQWAQIAKAKPGAGAASGAATTSSATLANTAQPKVRVTPISASAPTPMANSDSPPPERQSQLKIQIQPQPKPQVQPQAPKVVDVEVGTWAYHAEEFAIDRGCTLDDIGAELVSGDSASELHRVHCQDGSQVYVRCDREQCYGAR